MKAHERETEGRENRWRNWTSPLLTEGNSAVLLYPSSWSCISRWAFLCIYQWTKFWLRGPCSSFQGNLGKCQFCPPFFSSCLIFARLTLFSSLLPQPYFLLHFSIHFSPGYSTFIPYIRKKKKWLFSLIMGLSRCLWELKLSYVGTLSHFISHLSQVARQVPWVPVHN